MVERTEGALASKDPGVNEAYDGLFVRFTKSIDVIAHELRDRVEITAA